MSDKPAFVRPPHPYWHQWYETRFINKNGFPDVWATESYGPGDKVQHNFVRSYQIGARRFAITLKVTKSWNGRRGKETVKYETIQEVGDKEWYEGMVAIFEIYEGELA